MSDRIERLLALNQCIRMLEDEDILIGDMHALFKLRDELKAKFNGDVKT